jgi:alpha-amylase
MRRVLMAAAVIAAFASCGDVAAWKKRAVYQILTDRFWKSNGDTSLCDLHNYCGGDFAGMEK